VVCVGTANVGGASGAAALPYPTFADASYIGFEAKVSLYSVSILQLDGSLQRALDDPWGHSLGEQNRPPPFVGGPGDPDCGDGIPLGCATRACLLTVGVGI